MRIQLAGVAALLACVTTVRAAESFTVTVSHTLDIARPAEVIVVPFDQVQKRLPSLKFEQLTVRDAAGKVIPSQVTSFVQKHSGPPHYDDLIFQHDFAAGEKSAAFTVEASDKPVPPFESKVFCRAVPERFDDFAWENDKLAHRVYGPGLEKESAGKDRMTSSGIDVWCKRVPYLVVNRFYRKGHDGLHTDTGEGLDFYSVGKGRGVGGTGVWDGTTLYVSKNYASAMIYANGPLRAVFELKYASFDGGKGVAVVETKRVTVDAGSNFDTIESTFDFEPAEGTDGTITVAVGVAVHPRDAEIRVGSDEKECWLSVWEKYKAAGDGQLGSAAIAGPGATSTAFATTDGAELLVFKVKSGEKIRYLAGSGWNGSGEIADRAAWEGHVGATARRLASPTQTNFGETKRD